jgi:hypothetical protein
MATFEKLIDEIIPYPADYSHRNGFSNNHIIDNLSGHEKNEVENALISKLSEHPKDLLIVETLAYLKSTKSIPALKILLENSSNGMEKLIIASSMFEINKDYDLVDIAISAFRQLDNKQDAYYVFNLINAFYHLAKFNNPIIMDIIKEYIDHKEYLVSYNSKRVLGL